MNSSEFYMQRAIELAKKGTFYAAPNPMVGCVIVCNEQIIGEGYHEKYGGPHAEVNAINAVKDKSLLSSATAYVSLEPCAHFGKTPPCADLLVAYKLKKVVIAMPDPFPKVDGLGIRKLKDAGIEVEIGVLENQAKLLNKRFLCFHQKKRPYIILKWAQSADGFIAPLKQKAGEMTWISHPSTQAITHQWRAEESAILVGYNTVVKDNPSLTTRAIEGPSPFKIVLDPQGKIDASYKVFQGSNFLHLSFNNFPKASNNFDLLNEMVNYCVEHQLTSLIVEGGAKTHQLFMQANLWDEIRTYTSRKHIKNGIKACSLPQEANLTQEIALEHDVLRIYNK